MDLKQRNRDSAYLQFDKYVNFDHPLVEDKAKELASKCRTTLEIIEAVYYFVRDEIANTWDNKDSTITISASDVLENRRESAIQKQICWLRLCAAMEYIQAFVINV